MSPETELKDILKTISKPGWKWPLNRSPTPPEHTANLHYCEYSPRDGFDVLYILLILIASSFLAVGVFFDHGKEREREGVK